MKEYLLKLLKIFLEKSNSNRFQIKTVSLEVFLGKPCKNVKNPGGSSSRNPQKSVCKKSRRSLWRNSWTNHWSNSRRNSWRICWRNPCKQKSALIRGASPWQILGEILFKAEMIAFNITWNVKHYVKKSANKWICRNANFQEEFLQNFLREFSGGIPGCHRFKRIPWKNPWMNPWEKCWRKSKRNGWRYFWTNPCRNSWRKFGKNSWTILKFAKTFRRKFWRKS